ncbi:MAG: RNA 2',3'-cyclic phosphodiesterase [Clostridiales bacterium]|nr:RNA 2',3'-cyclic phosphodiesterase [Clostridiales bacterium]
MELFIAIGIERTLAKQIGVSAESCLAGLPAEEPADLHITLHYLGHTDRVNEVAERLRCVSYPPFSLQLDGYGAFVNESPKESVIWQGVKDPGRHLDALRARTAEAICDILPVTTGESFTPHITLAYTDECAPQLERLPDCCLTAGTDFSVSAFSLCCVLPERTPLRFQTIATYRLSSEAERKTVRLLCVNDFHASLRENSGSLGAAKLVRAVNDYKAANGDTAVLFGGDNFFGDPVSELYCGAPVLDVMRAVNAEVSVAGNHDFDFSVDQFRQWQDKSGVPMLAANLVELKTGEMPAFVQPYQMLRFGALKIAVIGLAMQEPMEMPDRPCDWKEYALTDGIAAARRWIEFLSAGKDPAGVPDAIVALTHFGLRETRGGELVGEELLRLADEAPELAGAFAAHFHRLIQATVGTVAVAEGGGTGKGFAAIALTFDRKRTLLNAVPLCYDLMAEKAGRGEDEAVRLQMDEYYSNAEREMGRTVAVAQREIAHRDPATNAIPLTGTPLTLLATDVMRKASGCPIALLYAGRIVGGFSAGPVSLYRFYQVFAFANIIVTARLTGRQIWANLQTGMRKLPEDGASPLAVGGLIVVLDPDRAVGERVLDIRLSDGTPLDMEAFYPVVFEDYLASDPLGFRFSDADALEYHDLTLRDLMLDELEQRKSLTGTYPDNIHIQRSGS